MAEFELSSFMNKYRDYARTYLFKCRIENFDVKEHEYLVKSTKLPESNITEIATDWQGNIYKIGGTAEVGDFNITFDMDSKGDLRDKFVHWSESIHNPYTNIHGAPVSAINGNGYFRDITLEHLNGQGDIVLIYKMIDTWPKSVGESTLDYTNKEVASFDVTFAYQYHTLEKKDININRNRNFDRVGMGQIISI